MPMPMLMLMLVVPLASTDQSVGNDGQQRPSVRRVKSVGNAFSTKYPIEIGIERERERVSERESRNLKASNIWTFHTILYNLC
ncbi:uncharacterized protein Dmoj_GI26727 [Drosophila mojavensis]|uniref:Secreted protein n=1 Tax=Drosophila mojavensis TaxID=7230 RepID=A0A0Q9WM49_DROMO|nr:uncharacterized protein Dmoj_GI26727 [Drosophila mojavensis]